KRFCSISFNIGRLLISLLMRTPPFLFSREKLLYQRRESSSYFLEIEGIFQLCPRKYFTHTKGIDLIGIIDCHVPSVQQEMKQLIATGKAQERPDGGIQFERATLLLGSEIEVYDEHCHGPIHVL